MAGRKRHILVDTIGLLLTVVGHAARVSEQAGARRILEKVATAKAAGRSFFQRLRLLGVDAGCQAGEDFCAWVKALLGWRVGVVRRPAVNAPKKAGFILRPRRWVVERPFCLAGQRPAAGQGRRAATSKQRDHGLPRHDQPHAPPPQTRLKTRFSHTF